MKKIIGLIALIGLVGFVASPQVKTVSNLSVSGPIGMSLAWRDTLSYTLRWGRAANATSYRVTVTAVATPAGTTNGLPTNAIVTDTTITFSAVNLTYDSMNLTASVTGVRGTQSGAAATKSWSVARKPGAPGAIIVDSTAIAPIVLGPKSDTVASVRAVYWVSTTGVKTLDYTSYDTVIYANCIPQPPLPIPSNTTCHHITSWECPVYLTGELSPPGCLPGFDGPPPPSPSGFIDRFRHGLDWAIALAQS